MKKKYIFLLVVLFLTSGCQSQNEEIKNEYITMKKETLNEDNYFEQTLPVDIVTTIERIGEEDINYKVVISNPKENMHDVKVMLVHNYYTESTYPSIGLFNNAEELLINNKGENTITLEDTIKTTTDISQLDLEMKMLIEYTNDNDEKKDIYYKTT